MSHAGRRPDRSPDAGRGEARTGECIPAAAHHPPAGAQEYGGHTEGFPCTRIPPVSFSASENAGPRPGPGKGPSVMDPTYPSSPSPLRIRLAPPGPRPARIDGAWWPYSRDLTAELPALTAVLDTRWERITRVTVNPAHWPVIPRKVRVAGHVVKVGWFTREQDPHQLMLRSYRTGRWDLLVIPPETPADTAAWLMAAAADPRRSSTGTALMDEAAARQPRGRVPEAGESVWESEGGQGLPPVARIAGTAA